MVLSRYLNLFSVWMKLYHKKEGLEWDTHWTGHRSIAGHTPVTHALTSPFTVLTEANVHDFGVFGGSWKDQRRATQPLGEDVNST